MVRFLTVEHASAACTGFLQAKCFGTFLTYFNSNTNLFQTKT